MLPRLFIGSSREALIVAEALQENLEGEVECTVWTQDAFELSKSFQESLLACAANHDFAAFIFSPDDLVSMRGKKARVVRDNVLFELGLFTGILGRDRTFFVSPTDSTRYQLPSDLAGIVYAGYRLDRSDKNVVAALGVVASKIKRQIKKVFPGEMVPALKRLDWFSRFLPLFPELIASSNNIVLYFIHSRRWREDNDKYLREFLRRSNSKLSVYLPDSKNSLLMESIRKHFDDGSHICAFVADAFRYFEAFQRDFPRKVSIYRFSTYPTYSFYIFDGEIVVAMYPTTPKRRDVPAFHCSMSHPFGVFVTEDIANMDS